MESNALVGESLTLQISQGRWDLRKLLIPAGVLTAFFLLAVGLQSLAGAYRAELSGYPDEPGHFVSGAFVRDYLTSFPPGPVVPFASEYYIRRPKMAIGHWPPALYLIEGIWFVLFGASRNSVLALMALICASIAATVALTMRRRYGIWTGIAGGLLFICLGFTQTQTSQVMADSLVALFGTWATLEFADFLESGAARCMFQFALFALLAIFTKNSGLYLVFVPPLSILLTKQFRVLANKILWLGAMAVAVPTIGWIVLAEKYQPARVTHGPGVQLFFETLRQNLSFLYEILGPFLLALAVIGIVHELRSNGERLPATLFSAAVSVVLFESVASLQSLAAAGTEPRYLTPAIAALIPFIFSGLIWLAGAIRLQSVPRMIRAVALLVLGVLISPHTIFAIPHKAYRGLSEVADFIQSDSALRHGAVLVSSATDGEGLLISEIVMRYPSSEGFILRASKILSQSDWMGRDYKSRFDSVDDMFAYLQKLGPNLIVIDEAAGSPVSKHQELLTEVCREHPEYWQPAGIFPIKSPSDVKGQKIYAYRRIGGADSSDATIHQEMQNVLGRMNVLASSF